ncbi:hypothetical protein SAMN02745163_02022 [Clostridium cavendishii DSM 21758]|uniref:SipL SPOCS domain-containing protein n=1 Tax=Clostridium cavendishii DSM 21758 TaxID=1121302 RepID=A0A1M6JG32_9CLOT|nr:hypothetical protein [Clostridium cavendishii]SHJ45647.1 hypothetical protein SAMN02745163_02022 [Clostridium cavendishii DSM 21758]
MSRTVINSIEIIGIADEFPKSPKYFSEFSIPYDILIPCEKPNISSILSVIIKSEISSLNVIDTPIRISNDGTKLSGNKLMVELKIIEQIKYVSEELTNCVYILPNNIIKTLQIVVPSTIHGEKLIDLFRKNKIIVKTYFEDAYFEIIDDRNIYSNLSIMVNVENF